MNEKLGQKQNFEGLEQNVKALIIALNDGKTSVSALAAAIVQDGEATRKVVVEESSLTRQHIDQATERIQRQMDLAFAKFNIDSVADPASKLLRSLAFPGMNSRRETVDDAFAETFKWIWKPNAKVDKSSDFTHWLDEGDCFYWLSGKAGSGKSTLINFILSSAETKSALSRWAGNASVVTISFFFWNSGKPLQKNTRGLLQACVFQILENDQKMASVVENLLAGSEQSPLDFDRIAEAISSETKLCDILLALLDKGKNKLVKYCFFVDALDECEGDRAVLLGLLDKLVARPHVKVCASSRPWPSFEHHFRFSARLILQDLTFNDISLYVRERLKQEVTRVNNGIADTSMEKLASEITSRSDGIFLWVVLVTREVREGLATGDSFDTLLNRLKARPPEVHDLIAVILDRQVEVVHRDGATEYLSLRSASKQPVDLLTFSVACLEEVQMATREDLTSILMYDAHPSVEEITKTFSARTAGLLEVEYDANFLGCGHEHPMFSLMRHDVGFLHGSVATVMEDSSSRNIASLSRLLKASVLIGTWLRNHKEAWSLSAHAYSQAFQFAKSISELDPDEHHHEGILDLLKIHTAHGYLTETSGGLFEQQYNFATFYEKDEDVLVKFELNASCDWLTIVLANAASFGLRTYASRKLLALESKQRMSIANELLQRCRYTIAQHGFNPVTEPYFLFLIDVLRAGADPDASLQYASNMSYSRAKIKRRSLTPWTEFLQNLTWISDHVQCYDELLYAFLSAGATINAKFEHEECFVTTKAGRGQASPPTADLRCEVLSTISPLAILANLSAFPSQRDLAVRQTLKDNGANDKCEITKIRASQNVKRAKPTSRDLLLKVKDKNRLSSAWTIYWRVGEEQQVQWENAFQEVLHGCVPDWHLQNMRVWKPPYPMFSPPPGATRIQTTDFFTCRHCGLEVEDYRRAPASNQCKSHNWTRSIRML